MKHTKQLSKADKEQINAQFNTSMQHQNAMRLIRSKFTELGEKKHSLLWDAIWERTHRKQTAIWS